jgi:hypothetical protein
MRPAFACCGPGDPTTASRDVMLAEAGQGLAGPLFLGLRDV